MIALMFKATVGRFRRNAPYVGVAKGCARDRGGSEVKRCTSRHGVSGLLSARPCDLRHFGECWVSRRGGLRDVNYRIVIGCVDLWGA